MSILTGKHGYDSAADWRERTTKALRERGGELYRYDAQEVDVSTLSWLTEVLSVMNPKPDILEFGSGFGRWSFQLDGLYENYLGVDIVQERVEHANNLHMTNHVGFVQIKEGWNLRRKFPVILCVTVLQHLTLPETVDALRDIERHLAPGGVALLAEWRLYDVSAAECEALYAKQSCAQHMIPKPIPMLKELVPGLSWSGSSGRWVLTHAA